MSGNPKLAKDFIPFCKDQGMPSILGAPGSAQSAYSFGVASMVAGGVITLPYPMENATYQCFVNDQTHPGLAVVLDANKTTTQITVTGASTADALDILIIGTLKNQVS